MPRKAKELSALDVRRLEHSGKAGIETKSVGGVDGLVLQLTPTGAKSWVLRCTVAGKRRNLGLGPYPTVSLAQAREAAREAHQAIREGVDPVERRKAARAALRASQRQGLTFAKAVDLFLENKLSEFRNDKHAKQWRSTLDNYALPKIGDMPVGDIGIPDMLRVLEPIWTRKTETASRLRGRIESVLAWATVGGHRTGDNPARWKGNLDAILPKPSKIAKVSHHPAIKIDEASQWFKDVCSRKGSATRALELLAMTGARSGEIRGAVWSEFDLAAGMWIIPASRMKAGREHRIPLTSEALEMLKGLERVEGSEFVFPAVRGGELSDAALSACMRRINEAREGGYLDRVSGRPAVPHGLRSTFRDWVAERTEYPRDMAEIQLAHTVGSEVERAYRRGDMMEKRRAMMAAWGRFLRGEKGQKVVSLNNA